MPRIEYCPCKDDTVNPCPACGATVEGKDKVHGVCQARHHYREPSYIQLVLIDKTTNAVVASTR